MESGKLKISQSNPERSEVTSRHETIQNEMTNLKVTRGKVVVQLVLLNQLTILNNAGGQIP